jgi:hypothetical protein
MTYYKYVEKADGSREIVPVADYETLEAELMSLSQDDGKVERALVRAEERIEQLEAALRLYWEAKTPTAMGAADAVAKRLLTPIVAPKEPPT